MTLFPCFALLRRSRRSQWFLSSLILAAGTGVPFHGVLRAQAAEGEALLVCDSTSDRVLQLTDLDGSLAVEAGRAGEVSVFYDDSSPGPDLSIPCHMAPGPDGSVYLLDGGTLDTVLALKDQNGDWDATDPGEVSVYYDASAGGPALGTPNTLLQASDGSYLLSDDGSRTRHIVWLKDTNGDGDALDQDESRVVYDGTALSTPVLLDIQALAQASDGAVYAADATLQAIMLLRDLDGDGTFLGAEEGSLYYQGHDDLSPGDVQALLIVEGVLYSCDKEAGKILRLQDANLDGDADDDGEACIFLDKSAAVRIGSVMDFLPFPGQGFIILENSKDAVLRVADLNSDGDALDEGEVVPWLVDDGSTLSTPSGLLWIAKQADPPPQDPTFLRGDASQDGILNISDPINVLAFLFLGSVTPTCPDALDADDNGALNITDAIYTLNFLFVGGKPPPPPYPTSGPDPTPDQLQCSKLEKP
jgi:hypothetical protein